MGYEELIEKANKVSFKSRSEIKKEVLKELETFVGTKAQIEEKEKELLEKVSLLEKEERNKYHNERNELWSKAQRKVEKECGIENKDKKALNEAWRIAWDYGHSSGYSNVVYHFIELSSLLDFLPDAE